MNEQVARLPDRLSPDPPATGAVEPMTTCILCVDDEPHILSSLRRVFKAGGYAVLIAESAAAGLQLLENEVIDLVISDMRMPHMNGARFLSLVRERWPSTMRILLTGQADVESMAEAINSGDIYRYIAKPWDDEHMLLQVRLALERRAFEQQKVRAEQMARARTEELKELNASLEQNVSASQDELSVANQRLKNNFIVLLKVFSSLMETRHKQLVGHVRRVADLARKLAAQLDLEPALVHEVFVAGLLHDMGKLAFTDDLLDRPVANMTPWQLQLYRQHPARAEALLMPLQDLRGAAASIGAQLERFDGTGFPLQLRGRAILVGARILAVCSDYDNLQIGVLAPRLLTSREALVVIERSSGKRYDPWVVEAFAALMRAKSDKTGADNRRPSASAIDPIHPEDDMRIDSADLVEGMVLSNDLLSPGGLMMLPSGHTIDHRLIQKMRNFEKTEHNKLMIRVKKPESDASANSETEQKR
jgi:response regulator RpfG family c-di-GMP phosphodiesterase